MISNPLVSVIMPIYGVEKYIENSVKSVIAQTYNNIELILVDDGSPDKSVEIAEKTLKSSNYPYVLIRQKNQGLGEARNTGLRNATGEWILFLDSDDVILPGTIEKFVKASNYKNVDLIFSNFNYIYNLNDINFVDGGSLLHYLPINLQNEFLMRKRLILASGSMMRRELLMNCQLFFSNIPWSEDQHFIWRLLLVIHGAVYIDEALYQYLQHPGSIMSASKIEKMVNSYPMICDVAKNYKKSNELVYRFLVPRWVMGTLNAAARVTEYENWILLYSKIDGKRHMTSLFRFPSFKVKVAVSCCLISKKFYYNTLKSK